MARIDYLRNIANSIRSNADANYKNVVPFLNEGDDISLLKNPLFTNELIYNTFYTGFTNMIYMTVFKSNKVFRNPLEILKRGNNELGADIREIAEDLLEEHQYNLSNELLADVLKLESPKVFQCIHRLNRKSYFKISISESELELAMNSWEAFDNLFIRKAELLYNSNYVVEFKWAKELLRNSVQNGNIELVNVPLNVVSEANALEYVDAIRDTVADFRYASTEHTMLSKMSQGEATIKVWTDPEDTVLVLPSKTVNRVDTRALAVAFNRDDRSFKVDTLLEVDELGFVEINSYEKTEDTEVDDDKTYYVFDNETYTYIIVSNPVDDDIENYFEATTKYYKLQGMIFDRFFTQIYDKKIGFWSMPIASAMLEQRYLHVWQTYSVSPFCNVRALVSEIDESDIPTGYIFKYELENSNDNAPTTITV